MSTAVPISTMPAMAVHVEKSLPTIRPLRRRPNHQQGHALQLLAHAIEYLADMRLWDEQRLPGDAEAMRLLMQCSRAVFQECAEVVPVRTRLMRWFSSEAGYSGAGYSGAGHSGAGYSEGGHSGAGHEGGIAPRRQSC